MGIDEDLNKVVDGLREAGIEVDNTVNGADVLAGIASLATRRADRMSDPDAPPENPEAVLRAIADIQAIAHNARKARLALARGDSKIAAMFDGSLERVQTQLADDQSTFQTTVGNTVHVSTRQAIVDTYRAVATSARGAANALNAALQQIGGGIDAKHKAVVDVIEGRY